MQKPGIFRHSSRLKAHPSKAKVCERVKKGDLDRRKSVCESLCAETEPLGNSRAAHVARNHSLGDIPAPPTSPAVHVTAAPLGLAKGDVV